MIVEKPISKSVLPKTQIRILMIGPLPPPVGGTRVSFSLLLQYLEKREDVEVYVIPLHHMRKNLWRIPFILLSEVFGLIRWAPKVDVLSLHCGLNVLKLRVWLVGVFARLLKKPLMVRNFGGGGVGINTPSSEDKKMLQPLMNSDLYLAQTKALLAVARSIGVPRAEWFPTHRVMSKHDTKMSSRSKCTRFVYVGHVRTYKGIHVLMDAMHDAPPEIHVDVFGPLFEDLPVSLFEGLSNLTYCGTLNPDEVITTMQRYDAFVMPTLADSEGYPGVVLEAYQAGLPVIASRIGAIPEILDESCGLLVEPGNVDDLRKAILDMYQNDDSFHQLREGVMKKSSEFDVQYWADRFVEWCRELSRVSQDGKRKQRT